MALTGYIIDWETCLECHGRGFIVVCCDDMCRGLGECIHGDGEDVCFECGGEGIVPIYDDDEVVP